MGEISREMRERWTSELHACLARETAAWEAKPPQQLLHELGADIGMQKGAFYDVEFQGVSYCLNVHMLDADAETLTLLVQVEPNDPSRIEAIAVPRSPGQFGYSDENTGSASEVIVVPLARDI